MRTDADDPIDNDFISGSHARVLSSRRASLERQGGKKIEKKGTKINNCNTHTKKPNASKRDLIMQAHLRLRRRLHVKRPPNARKETY